MSEWQLIATAPKDGTEILGCDITTGKRHVTRWTQYGWHDPDSHYYSQAEEFNPSHWVPILDPPKP